MPAPLSRENNEGSGRLRDLPTVRPLEPDACSTAGCVGSGKSLVFCQMEVMTVPTLQGHIGPCERWSCRPSPTYRGRLVTRELGSEASAPGWAWPPPQGGPVSGRCYQKSSLCGLSNTLSHISLSIQPKPFRSLKNLSTGWTQHLLFQRSESEVF